MNKKILLLLLSPFILSVPAFANHGVDAMGDGLAILFGIGLIALILAIISIIVSYRAFRKNKTSLKIGGTILTVPFGVIAILLIQFSVLGALIAALLVLLNMLLIINAKTRDENSTSKPTDSN